MTEDEAKTKWCPMVRANYRPVSTANRTDSGKPLSGGQSNCIGSACMAWRTRTTRELDQWSAFVDKTTGYCGLAGAPQ